MKLRAEVLLHRALLSTTLLLFLQSRAQDTVMALPETSRPAPILRDSSPPSQSSPSDPSGAIFQFGSVSFHPSFTSRYIYGLGLPSEDGRHVASVIYTQAASLRIDAGQHWTLDYSPTWTNYTARAIRDTFAQSLSLSGAGMLQDWAINFSERYSDSTPLLIETGRPTAQRTWATQLGASHAFTKKVSFQTSANLNELYSEISPDTRDWSTMNWLVLQLSTRIQTGLGLGAGYTEIVAQPDATNERYMARFNWKPTDKLTLSMDGGLEARHSRASAARDMNNPILSASLGYQPFDTTSIALSNSRTVTTSYFQNQVTVGSGWNLSLRQRLLGHVFISMAYSLKNSSFESATTDLTLPEDPAADPGTLPPLLSLPGREDRVESINIRLTTQLLTRWSVTASFQRSYNHSNQIAFNYTSTQFGIELGLRY